MMPRTTRGRVLALALLATVAAAALAPPPREEEIAAPVARPVAHERSSGMLASGASGQAPEQVLEIRPRRAGDLSKRAFASASWAPPRVAAVVHEVVAAPTPVAAPTAPPLPFRLIGRYVEDNRMTAFLQLNERTLVVHAGDTIDTDYRLDNISDSSLTFTYLPLNQKQSLAAASTN